MSDEKYCLNELSENDFGVWNEFVEKSSQGFVFHQAEWIKTSATALNVPYKLIGVFSNDKLVGGLPLYIRKKYLLPYVSSTLPLSPFGGFILQNHISTKIRENEKNDNNILHCIRKYLEEEKRLLISIQSSPAFKDVRPFSWNSWGTAIHYTYIQNLTGDIWKNISNKVRNVIRKAEKTGIRIEKEYDPDVYWNLNIDTYKKQGMQHPPINKKLLYDLMDLAIKKNFGEMWIARMPNGDVASGEFVLWDTKMAHRWSAASNSQYSDTGVTSLLLYNIFLEMQNKGYTKMNMMAANTPQLTKFISSFNPELIPQYVVKKVNIPPLQKIINIV